jgi:hypothetical protein
MARSTSRQMYLWAAYVGLLLGCGWWKDAENREDIERQSRWQAYIGELRVESKNHYDEVVDWMGMNSSPEDAREKFEQRFAGEYTLTSRDEGDRVEARWVHSKYGYAVNVTFQDKRVIGHGANWGSSDVEQVFPAPPVVRFTSHAERIRRFAARWLQWAWLVLLPLALFSRRRGMIAAHAGFAVALAYAVAQLTAPNYSLTSQGIFSNDPLVVAALMFLCSVVLLAKRSTTSLQRLKRMKFRLRTMLLLTTLCAIAAAAGPLGWVAIGAVACGAPLYLFVLTLRAPWASRTDISRP